MAKDRISIPVEVTGDEKAKQDLQSVADTARGTQSGTLREGEKAQQRYAHSTEKATKAQDAFNDSAKTALTGILGQLSPQLAALGSVVVDVAKGISQMSLALMGLIGLGVALGGIVSVFQGITERAERMRRATERARDALREAAEVSLSWQEESAQHAESADVLGRGREIRDRAMALSQQRGVPRDLAFFGAVAEQVAGKVGVQGVDAERMIGAYILTGRSGEFGHSEAANRTLLTRLMAVPEQRAAAALRAKLTDAGLPTMAAEGDATVSNLERQLLGVHKRLQTTGLSERERAAALDLLRAELTGDETLSTAGSRYLPIEMRARMSPEMERSLAGRRGLEQMLQRRITGDATHTLQQVLNEARRIHQDIVRAVPSTAMPPINITIDRSTHVDTVLTQSDRIRAQQEAAAALEVVIPTVD